MTDVFLLAVVASLDGGLVAAAVVLLGRPRPARKLLAYLAGAMGCSFAFGLVIVFVLHRSTLLRGPSPSTSALIEVVAGILLLIVVAIAVRWGHAPQWRPRRRARDDPGRKSLHERAVGHDSLWIAWAAGALYSVPGVYYVAGMALLAKLGRPLLTDVLPSAAST